MRSPRPGTGSWLVTIRWGTRSAVSARRRSGGRPVRPSPPGRTSPRGPVGRSRAGWAARALAPARIVDPGTGSARFLVAAGRRWPHAALIGVETDPLAAMIGRATLAVAGMAGRASITLGD